MYIERNIVSGRHGTKDFDDSDNEKDSEGNYTVWVISKDVNVVTPYTYDEAISLAGHGCYTIGLLTVCSLSLLAMCLDIFGFPTIVSSSSYDFEIGQWQYNVLLSMPFLGAMLPAYMWGYVLDTRGRRLSLIVAMWGSFAATTASAFSPNWQVLAALKFISVSFCSCAQAASYTLVGECCPLNVKRTYFYILTSVMHLTSPIYTVLGYVSLNMSFSWNLGFLTFTPWRLMALCMGLPLGISAVCLHFFYESPKFLASVGEKGLALECLRAIWRRNSCVGKKYPVDKLITEEEGNVRTKSMPLLKSLWEQTAPLFKKPLLLRALQLYFLNIVIYSAMNSLLVWFPFLVNSFISGMSSHNIPEGMCKIIEHCSQNLTDTYQCTSCIPKSNITVVWASAVQGLALVIFNVVICWVGDRKLLIIVMMTIMSASAVGCVFFENNVISLFLFFTMFFGVVSNGIVSSYFFDFFPTSYRGMAACLSAVVARASGLIGSNVSGIFIISHCSYTFYVIAFNIFCGVLVAIFLPSDRVKHQLLRKKQKKKKLSM